MTISELLFKRSGEYTNGFVLATLAFIAYDANGVRRKERVVSVGLEEVASIECESGGLTGLEAYTLRHGSELVISFRGSQELLDFVTDADLTKTRIGGILVHRGFARSAARFTDAFRSLRPNLDPYDRIWITGHSLGGAGGQIAGYLLHKMDETLANVTTFGSPRVGGIVYWKNVLNAESISDKYVRWVNITGGHMAERFDDCVGVLDSSRTAWIELAPPPATSESSAPTASRFFTSNRTGEVVLGRASNKRCRTQGSRWRSQRICKKEEFADALIS